MLARDYRLLKKNDFKRVFEQGTTRRGPVFILRALSRADAAVSRFGIIVSRKVSPKAVRRNQIKRCLRAALTKPLTSFTRPVDLVIIVQVMASKMTNKQLTAAFMEMLVKLKPVALK